MNPQSIKVLVVDDSELDSQLLASFLLDNGYELFVARNGLEAVEIARQVVPDIILMDVYMPRLDGYATSQVMSGIPELESIPIIFLTAAASPKEKVKGLQLGAVDYITKPYDFEEVVLRLNMRIQSMRPDKFLFTRERESQSMEPHVERLARALFKSASSLMLADLSAELSMDELTGLLRTNSKRLNQAFLACSGMTAFEYLREMRMLEAKRLLGNTLQEINVISVKVGFKIPANFSSAFRRRFGMSPRAFRNSSTQAT